MGHLFVWTTERTGMGDMIVLVAWTLTKT